ncbi:hypothetical protein StoSoilA2_20960 [Arthrobacter sp. StoSoilA2]|nr:hypothetical protein StoSoilA2_20960 [Arthrobacter sp. StoSoilA2]
MHFVPHGPVNSLRESASTADKWAPDKSVHDVPALPNLDTKQPATYSVTWVKPQNPTRVAGKDIMEGSRVGP